MLFRSRGGDHRDLHKLTHSFPTRRSSDLTLLGLVARVGTGTGFTIAQLSLLINASIGIWLFKVPPPGSVAAKLAMAGIVIAGSGGAVIGALR